jgi:seryl-tRNA synthetase
MLDLKGLRHDPDAVRARLAVRGDSAGAGIDRILALDERRRVLIGEGDELKARRNAVSREVGEKKRAGEDADDLIREMRGVGERISSIDRELRGAEGEIEDILLGIPNPPHPSVPEGGEEANVVVRTWGEPRELPFEPRPTGSWARSSASWTCPPAPP